MSVPRTKHAQKTAPVRLLLQPRLWCIASVKQLEHWTSDRAPSNTLEHLRESHDSWSSKHIHEVKVIHEVVWSIAIVYSAIDRTMKASRNTLSRAKSLASRQNQKPKSLVLKSVGKKKPSMWQAAELWNVTPVLLSRSRTAQGRITQVIRIPPGHINWI